MLDMAIGISSRKCAEALPPLAASALVAGGLAAYTAFNEYSSGLMLGAAPKASTEKAAKKGRKN